MVEFSKACHILKNVIWTATSLSGNLCESSYFFTNLSWRVNYNLMIKQAVTKVK